MCKINALCTWGPQGAKSASSRSAVYKYVCPSHRLHHRLVNMWSIKKPLSALLGRKCFFGRKSLFFHAALCHFWQFPWDPHTHTESLVSHNASPEASPSYRKSFIFFLPLFAVPPRISVSQPPDSQKKKEKKESPCAALAACARHMFTQTDLQMSCR